MEKVIPICKRATRAFAIVLLAVFAASEAAWFAARQTFRNPPASTGSAVVFHASVEWEDEHRRAAARTLANAGALEQIVFVGGTRPARGANGAARQAALFDDETGGLLPALAGTWSYDTVTNVEEANSLVGQGWVAVSDCLHLVRIVALARGAATDGYCSSAGGPGWRFMRSLHEAVAWSSLALPQSWRDRMVRSVRLGGDLNDPQQTRR